MPGQHHRMETKSNPPGEALLLAMSPTSPLRDNAEAIRVDLRGAGQRASSHRCAEHDLARIEAALERLDAGRYGYCQECGAAIGVKRLDGDPAAAFCAPCSPGN